MRAQTLLTLLLAACADDPETITLTEVIEVEVETDAPPVVATIPAVTGWVGEETSLQLGAYVSDDGAPAVNLSYTLDAGEGGFDGSRWTHTFTEAGTSSVAFTVSDAEGQTATGSFEITVVEPASAVDSPSPVDGAELVPVEVVLAWAGGGGADGFDVYFGTDPLAVAQADTTSDVFMGTVTATEWDAGRLDPEQPYYWRVDATLGDEAYRGTLWSFGTEPENHLPVFWGVQGAAFLGPDAVQLTWQAGQDKETAAGDLTYAVYAGTTEVDWSAPVLETSDLSAVLTSAELADIGAGATLMFAVRCVDALGDDDGNTAAITVTLPDAGTTVVFVDDDAASGGDGSLATPYADLGAAIADIDAAGGGIIAMASGSWAGTWTLDALGGVHVFGGFPTLSTLDAAATEAELLAARDPEANPTEFTDPTTPQAAPTFELGGAVTLGGLHFTDFSGTALDGTDAQVALWDTRFVSTETLRDGQDTLGDDNQVVALSLRSGAAGGALSLDATGVTAAWLDDAFRVHGVVSDITLRNSDFSEFTDEVWAPRVETVDEGGAPTWTDSTITVPDGGAFTLTVDNSSFFRVDAVTSSTRVQPQTEGVGGDFNLFVHDLDALALHSSSAFNFSQVAAAGGDVTVDYRDSTLWGVSSDCLYMSLADDNGQASGDVSITIEDNVCRHSNSDGFDIGSITVADGGTTDIHMRRNELGHLEGAAHRFSFWGGYDAENPQPDGLIDIEVSEGWCWNCDDGVYLSSAKGTDTHVTVFNNHMTTLYEGVELSAYADELEQARVSAYIGFNTNVSSFEGTASRMNPTDDATFAFRNNASGFNDVDSSEALRISGNGPGTGWVDVRNNVLSRGGGEGLDAYQAFPIVVNNTFAYNGRESSSNPGVRGHSSDDYGQLVVENSIVFANSGGDLGTGVGALWSVIGDHTVDQGAFNIQADPVFTERGDVLDFDGWFRLMPSSPAIDAGNPDARLNDADGTPNDIGAFGGPGGSVVGWLGAGAELPLEVIGIHGGIGLAGGGELPGGTTPLVLELTRSIDSDTGLSVTAGGAAVAGAWAFGDRSATFTPTTDWPAEAVIEVAADGTLTSVEGVANRFAWSHAFATAPAATTAETADANDDFASAQALSGGVWSVTGALSDTDPADHYRFTVSAAGERLTLASFGDRWYGDGLLVYEIQDGTGAVVHRGSRYSFYAADGYWSGASQGDSFLDHVFAEAGDYALVVYDLDGVIGEGEARDYGFQAWLR